MVCAGVKAGVGGRWVVCTGVKAGVKTGVGNRCVCVCVCVCADVGRQVCVCRDRCVMCVCVQV